MAANYTANYNLCQWEATDQVLRTDFNQDNAKIDAALGDTLGKIQLATEAVLENNSHTLELNLSGFDWDAWSLAFIWFLPIRNGNASVMSLDLNGISLDMQSYCSGTMASGLLPRAYLLFPMHDGTKAVTYLTFPDARIFTSLDSYDDITSVKATTGNSAIPAGSKIQVYGLR